MFDYGWPEIKESGSFSSRLKKIAIQVHLIDSLKLIQIGGVDSI